MQKHQNRGAAFMLTMSAELARLTLWKAKNCILCLTSAVQWYSAHWNTAKPSKENASLASPSQSDIVTLAASLSLKQLAGWEGRGGRIPPLLPTLSTRLKRVVSSGTRPLYRPVIHRITSWVSRKAGCGEERNFCLCWESNFSRPAYRLSLHWSVPNLHGCIDAETSASVNKGSTETGPAPSRDDCDECIALNFGIWQLSQVADTKQVTCCTWEGTSTLRQRICWLRWFSELRLT